MAYIKKIQVLLAINVNKKRNLYEIKIFLCIFIIL